MSKKTITLEIEGEAELAIDYLIDMLEADSREHVAALALDFMYDLVKLAEEDPMVVRMVSVLEAKFRNAAQKNWFKN